ncbi:MAG: aminotransferase class III-fold pyridoxal phosphate-dependent enzyme [Kofleriaceae bacterium]
MKLAFQYQRLTRGPGRDRFLRLAQGYHGDTLGAVGVGGIEVFHRIFGPIVVPGVGVTPPYRGRGVDEPAALARALAELDQVLDRDGDSLAAVVVEPLIQGAAGMLTHVPGYLRELVARCRARGLLVIVDEVATGFGRTGPLFACEVEDVEPDLMCVAKGLTAGYLPLAATLTRSHVYEAFLGDRAEGRHFFHGHTFTANPLACAVAIESLRMFSDDATRHYAGLGDRLQDAIERHIHPLAAVKEVRRVGAMVGIELEPGASGDLRGAQVCERVRADGVILRPLGNVVVWMPPLGLADEDVTLLAEATARAIAASS